MNRVEEIAECPADPQGSTPTREALTIPAADRDFKPTRRQRLAKHLSYLDEKGLCGERLVDPLCCVFEWTAQVFDAVIRVP